MDDYIERVNRAAAERIGEPVFNGSIDHARVIAAAMFKNARRSVDIFSGNLNPRVYAPDNVMDEAEFFLADTNHTVRILLEHAPDERETRHPFLRKFGEYQNVQIRVLDNKVSEQIPYHLMVADDDCYRFEQDKKQVAAIASWGDKKGGEHLKEIFEALWGCGTTFRMASAEPALALVS